MAEDQASANCREAPPAPDKVAREKGSQAKTLAGIVDESSLKRKRSQSDRSEAQLPRKPPSLSSAHALAQDPAELQSPEIDGQADHGAQDPVHGWVMNDAWPRAYFEPGLEAERSSYDSWAEEMAALPPPPVVQYKTVNGHRIALPLRKTAEQLREMQGSASSANSENNKDRKLMYYRYDFYDSLLERKGSRMLHSRAAEFPTTEKELIRNLCDAEQIVPEKSTFNDGPIWGHLERFSTRNAAAIMYHLTRYIAPSVFELAASGATHLDNLTENTKETWTECIPFEGPRPQPDYCVGFERSAFTNEQLLKLSPFVGTVYDSSYYVATFRMFFPFLTCEVGSSELSLGLCDRMNAHSMTIAVRGVVELFKLVKREKELDRKILAFSVSHDHNWVMIYGHYPVIKGDKVTYHRRDINSFSFKNQDGCDRWTAYRFTRNVYDIWMPTHHARICSAIDQLPEKVDFGVEDNLE